MERLEIKKRKKGTNGAYSVIRVDGDIAAELMRLSEETNYSVRELSSLLLRFALENSEVIE